jgi:hypothetical protein
MPAASIATAPQNNFMPLRVIVATSRATIDGLAVFPNGNIAVRGWNGQ